MNLELFPNLVKDHIENPALHGEGVIKVSNTAYVNPNLAASIPTQRIFITYAAAVAWIIANGTPSAVNTWQIIMPAGTVGNVVLSNKYIYVNCNKNTIIENLSCTIPLVATDAYLYPVQNATINNIVSTRGTLVPCFNCIILNVTSTEETAGYLFLKYCQIFKGNFDYITFLFNSENCLFYSLLGDISGLSQNFNNCRFEIIGDYNISFKSSETYWKLYYCYFIGDFIFQSVNIDFNFCSSYGNIYLQGSVNINAIRSFITGVNCTIEDELTINSIDLNESSIDTITGSDFVVNITTKGSSSYKRFIGSIDFNDFNDSESSTEVKVQFENGIPVGKYIDAIYYKFTEKFQTYSGGYSGLTINDLEQTHTPSIINEVDNIVVDTFNAGHSNLRDIEITATLSGENTNDWTSGNIDVYATFKSIPTL